MKIEYEKTAFFKYAFSFNINPEVIDYCRYLKDIYGWKQFNYHDGKWRFNDMTIGIEIKKKFPNTTIDQSVIIDYAFAEMNIEERKKRDTEAIRLKTATVSSLKILGLKHDLYNYQKVGVEFFINSGGRAINADQMGCGKSVQSLAYITYTNKKALIICPASVKYSWENEIIKWTKLKYEIVTSKSSKNIFKKKVDIFVINYDIIIKFYKEILNAGIECVVVDEFTFIKNNRAIRTKVVKKIASQISSVLLLSGTPMLSRPVELFNALNIIDPFTWNDFVGYTKRYCNGHQGRFGWDANGATNIDELKERISKYFIRRIKSEILPDLPEKIFINRPVELPVEWQEKYSMAINRFSEFLRKVRGKEKIDIIKSLQAEKLVKLGELRQLTTMGKIDEAEAIIRQTIDNGEKILVFSCYNTPLEILHKKFKNHSVLLIGKTSEEDRREAIDIFQGNEKINIFFGGTQSAGIGITLTAATNVLFIDYSWTPADHAQAIDRIHRPGQKAAYVTIYNLYAKGTIDEYMTKTLERKQILFDRLIEGKQTSKRSTNKSMINDVLRMIEKKAHEELFEKHSA